MFTKRCVICGKRSMQKNMRSIFTEDIYHDNYYYYHLHCFNVCIDEPFNHTNEQVDWALQIVEFNQKRNQIRKKKDARANEKRHALQVFSESYEVM